MKWLIPFHQQKTKKEKPKSTEKKSKKKTTKLNQFNKTNKQKQNVSKEQWKATESINYILHVKNGKREKQKQTNKQTNKAQAYK